MIKTDGNPTVANSGIIGHGAKKITPRHPENENSVECETRQQVSVARETAATIGRFRRETWGYRDDRMDVGGECRLPTSAVPMPPNEGRIVDLIEIDEDTGRHSPAHSCAMLDEDEAPSSREQALTQRARAGFVPPSWLTH